MPLGGTFSYSTSAVNANPPGSLAWLLNGNTVGSEKWIGTIDNFAFPIRTNNIEKMAIGTDGTIYRGSGSRNLFSVAFSTTITTWGYNAGIGGVSGANNSFFGGNAGAAVTTGVSNVFIGANAGLVNVIGNNNVSVGTSAGNASTDNNNTYLGHQAGAQVTTGSDNVYIGCTAGRNFLSGVANGAHSGNISIGLLSSDGSFAGSNWNIYMGQSIGRGSEAATVTRNIIIGHAITSISYTYGQVTPSYASPGLTDVLMFGNLPTATASNQITFGSATYFYTQELHYWSATAVHGEFYSATRPETTIAGQRGSVAFYDDGTLGEMWLKTANVSNVGWQQVLAGFAETGTVTPDTIVWVQLLGTWYKLSAEESAVPPADSFLINSGGQLLINSGGQFLINT